MDINYYKKFEPIDGKWYIIKELGSGAFGTVFEVERRDFSRAKSALKIITIPSSPNEVNSYREDNYDLDEKSISSYFYGFVEEFTDEFKLMTKLRGNSNIVSIEDYDVIEHKDEIGWDIFIRMELLTPMNKYFRDHELSQRDIIKLGIDICKALEVCQKYKIIHRDIKPSNIFVSDTGAFKLGDFGIARTLEKTSSGLSKKGTYTYMAPEVHASGEYGSNVDIYSLGIVMYKLLNNNFEPFRTKRTHTDEEAALSRRLKGEKIPKPANADGRLAEIVLKACSFNPKERYESPLQMREELENILYSESEAKVIYPEGDDVGYEASTDGKDDEKTVSMFGNLTIVEDEEEPSKTVSLFHSDEIKSEENIIIQSDNKATDILVEIPKSKKTSWKIPLFIIGIIAICILAFVGSRFISKNNSSVELVRDYANEIKFVAENGEWIMSGSQIISIEPRHSEETGYCFLLEFSTDGLTAFSDASQKYTGQAIYIYVGDELISAPTVSETIYSNPIMISMDDEETFNGIMGELGISDKKTVSSLAVARDFNSVNEIIESIKADEEKYQMLRVEIEPLAIILKNHQDDIQNGAIDELNDYEDCVNNMHPAWDKLSTAINNADTNESEEETAEPKQTEAPVEESVSQEQPATSQQTSTTTKSSQTSTATSNQNTVKKCSVCGSTAHTKHPTCPVCGSTSHTSHPTCAVCGSSSHTSHPTCPVCGSTSHTSHPIELPKENTQAPPSIPYYE